MQKDLLFVVNKKSIKCKKGCKQKGKSSIFAAFAFVFF